MRAPLAFAAAAAALLLSITMASMPAQAGCKRFGFLVNDYGKDGPIHDAKELLDKNIAEWAAKQGIKDYKVGKKSVSCELFLNFIVFDEHTCTASANVCWGADQSKIPTTNEANATGIEGAAGASPPAPVRKAAAERAAHAGSHKAGHKLSEKTTETPPAAAAADAATDASSPEAAAEAAARAAARDSASPSDATMAPVDTVPTAAPVKSTAEAPPAAPAMEAAAPAKSEDRLEKMAAPGAAVETGALPHDAAPADMPPAASGKSTEAVSEKAKAAAAASAAAAAAERAAAAAETAANAAKEAAAAAVAASAASRGAFVPPLGETALTDKSKSARSLT